MRRTALLALLLIATATAAGASQEKFTIRLLAPSAQTEVDAGSTQILAWQNDGTLRNVEEWEAFLSVDGGRTYPIRITPHLDASIHAFPWSVPLLPGADVSILLRLGDEREEHAIVFPERLRIRKAIPPETLAHQIDAQVANRSDILNDHGTLLVDWVDGTRDGRALRHTIVHNAALAAVHDFANRDPDPSPVVSRDSIPSPIRVAAAAAIAQPSTQHAARSTVIVPSDILTLVRRLNI